MASGKESNGVKLPILTKVAAWWMLAMGVILILLSFFLFAAAVALPDGGFGAFIAIMVISIAIVFYFLPGIFLFCVKARWAWIPPIILFSIIAVISFGVLLYAIYDNLGRGFPPGYFSLYEVGTVSAFICFSFTVPLVLVLLNRLSYKIVMLIPLSMVIVAVGSTVGVVATVGSYHQQSVAFEERMEIELCDLYGQAVEDGDTKGCQACAEVSQYFYEELNALPENVRAQTRYDVKNDIKYRYCLEAVAYLTQNVSVCECVADIEKRRSGFGVRPCGETVKALMDSNISICNEDEWCTTMFAIITDNSSVCDQLPYYNRKDCLYAYDYSEGDIYKYFGLCRPSQN